MLHAHLSLLWVYNSTQSLLLSLPPLCSLFASLSLPAGCHWTESCRLYWLFPGLCWLHEIKQHYLPSGETPAREPYYSHWLPGKRGADKLFLLGWGWCSWQKRRHQAAAALGHPQRRQNLGFGIALHLSDICIFMGKVWKQQMYPQYTTYYYPQYLQAKVGTTTLVRCYWLLEGSLAWILFIRSCSVNDSITNQCYTGRNSMEL